MRKLVLTSILLALVVIVLGAYTRLTDAGLGCPDWPGCYGHLIVPQTEVLIDQANTAFPERPVEAEKAWNEMVHRYFAAALGLLVLIIAALAFIKRSHHTPLKLPLLLVGLVCFQGALGMWTVTLNLLPAVVMGHLLGGFTVLSCLFLLYLRLTHYRIPGGDPQLKPYAKYAAIGIVILVGQIALGGWTSANYAALACTEFPLCEGNWFDRIDVLGAFSIPEAQNYEFGAHSYPERMTMHIAHRIGAIFTAAYLLWLAFTLHRKASSGVIKSLSVLIVVMLSAQVLLGISNIVYSLPLAVAVAHNAVAACLLLVMVLVTYSLYRKI
ncbi:COX15/CtaA family protein [Alteromonas oceanisediminis]|uniref:COX15/CtaA family protein n=1 Tax=Alteromonas oceanisediminis TaxID=2836180 RepID=UPI001BD9D740|nr:COX15/CtaA family protein [Alteromonas oceanisediminis]MBT0587886.1 heme A synthase [Alteromonas oceanisediminis]